MVRSLRLPGLHAPRASHPRQTLYDLASVTKVTGTTAVFMQLVQQGKVRIVRSGQQIPPGVH